MVSPSPTAGWARVAHGLRHFTLTTALCVTVSDMDRNTQQNAALVEQIAAASVNLKEQANALMGAISAFQAEGH